MTSPLLFPSDSFRDEGLGEEAHVAKGVAYSLPVSVPAFRRSPKKGSSDNDDERVSERCQLLGVTMSHTYLYTSLIYTVTLQCHTVTHLYTSLMYAEMSHSPSLTYYAMLLFTSCCRLK